MSSGSQSTPQATISVGVRDLAIGVDIGGTFTDCIVAFDDGRIVTAKTPTTPHDRSEGFFSSIERGAEKLAVSLPELLGRCHRMVHGTTTGTNAIVSRDGSTVGLLTTEGHGHATYMMRGSGRTAGLPADELLNISSTYKPQPLVPHTRIIEIPERIDVDGEEIVPLDEQRVREAVAELLDSGCDAIAISFIWSIKNPEHERRTREIVAQLAPGTYVCNGADLVRSVGEYERTTTAIMNAYIGPLMLRYIDAIQKGAEKRGYDRGVLFAQCGGGAISAEEARLAPIRTVQSGPVAGIVASSYLAGKIGTPNVLAADMGGTTFDVSAIRNGEPLERSSSIFQRLELALPMFDVESIGAGGGSIAWLDSSGRLNVGPKSAGADPGPACYGRGDQPTVTDADVVLGILDPGCFLHGRMKVDAERSETVIQRLADQLGLGLYETAAGIVRIVDSRMADLIRRMSVMRGFDPRKFCCFAFGGGGPVHAAAVAREAGLRQVIVPLPWAAALWSAFGAATADVVHVYQHPENIHLPADGSEVNRIFSELGRRALRQLREQGFADEDIVLVRRLRMKYAMQVHDVDVAVRDTKIDSDQMAVIEQDFVETYEELFGKGSGHREGGIEITGFNLRAIGRTAKPEISAQANELEMLEPNDTRKVYWAEHSGFVDTPVCTLEDDQGIVPLEGPCLIQLPDTVIVVRPGQRAFMDDYGNILIDIQT